MSERPAVIGRYQVERLLGEGGMGVLYLAADPVLERHVALKLLRVDSADLRRRFVREAQSAARIQHPNIVTVYDVGDHEGQLYIAMEYIDGDTLASLIRDNVPFSPIRKLDIVDEIADGLGFAHQRGIIHRDVKPANLMITRSGLVKVLDFGIARVAHKQSGEIDGPTLVGTPAYMAPEQLEGAEADARSDIYAVGLVMYELFSGRRAFAGATTADVLQMVLEARPTPIDQLVPDIDPDLARVVVKAMARLPQDRYVDLQAMRKDLARARRRAMQATADDATIVVGMPVAAVFTPPPKPAAPPAPTRDPLTPPPVQSPVSADAPRPSAKADGDTTSPAARADVYTTGPAARAAGGTTGPESSAEASTPSRGAPIDDDATIYAPVVVRPPAGAAAPTKPAALKADAAVDVAIDSPTSAGASTTPAPQVGPRDAAPVAADLRPLVAPPALPPLPVAAAPAAAAGWSPSVDPDATPVPSPAVAARGPRALDSGPVPVPLPSMPVSVDTVVARSAGRSTVEVTPAVAKADAPPAVAPPHATVVAPSPGERRSSPPRAAAAPPPAPLAAAPLPMAPPVTAPPAPPTPPVAPAPVAAARAAADLPGATRPFGGSSTVGARKGLPVAVILGGIGVLLVLFLVLALVAVRAIGGVMGGGALSGLFTRTVEPKVVAERPVAPTATAPTSNTAPQTEPVAAEAAESPSPATEVAVEPPAEADAPATPVAQAGVPEPSVPAPTPPPAPSPVPPRRVSSGDDRRTTRPPPAAPVVATRPSPPPASVREESLPAREVTREVARETPAPVREEPVRREPVAPREEAVALVRAYVAARNTSHAGGIRRVWPGVDESHLRRITSAFSAPLTLGGCAVEAAGEGRATATCTLTQPGTTGVYAPNQALTIRRTFVFDLVEQGRGWVIAGLRE